jgi:hypothetical protein
VSLQARLQAGKSEAKVAGSGTLGAKDFMARCRLDTVDISFYFHPDSLKGNKRAGRKATELHPGHCLIR